VDPSSVVEVNSLVSSDQIAVRPRTKVECGGVSRAFVHHGDRFYRADITGVTVEAF